MHAEDFFCCFACISFARCSLVRCSLLVIAYIFRVITIIFIIITFSQCNIFLYFVCVFHVFSMALFQTDFDLASVCGKYCIFFSIFRLHLLCAARAANKKKRKKN